MEVIFLFSKSNIILLYYIAIYGNGSEVCESIRPSYILFNFVRWWLALYYTNYNTRLKLLQPEIYPAMYM